MGLMIDIGFVMFLFFLGHELLEPAIRNRPLWPWLRTLFRKREGKVDEET